MKIPFSLRKSKRSNWVLPYLVFLLIFVVVPLILIGLYSFFDYNGNFTLKHFVKFFTQTEILNTFIYSIVVASVVCCICILIAYPAAFFLARMNVSRSRVLIMLFILPMFVNVLIRSLATVALFDFLHIELGEGALLFGLTYDFLPFMIFPIYNSIIKIDPALIEAAQDLGATISQLIRKVILPLSAPGITSGIMMVFLPAISTFAISEILTLNNKRLFGSVIQENIMITDKMNFGAALSLIMLVIIYLSLMIDRKKGSQEEQETSF